MSDSAAAADCAGRFSFAWKRGEYLVRLADLFPLAKASAWTISSEYRRRRRHRPFRRPIAGRLRYRDPHDHIWPSLLL